MARALEESGRIIPFINNHLSRLELPHQLVVNRDPDYRRELHAMSLRTKQEVVREYDGLWVVNKGPATYLLNIASHLHLTRDKFEKMINALLTVTNTMIPSWKQYGDDDTLLRRRCPHALEDVVSSHSWPYLSLIVTYSTIEDGFDVREETSDELVRVEFVQLDTLSMGKNLLQTAVDRLLDD